MATMEHLTRAGSRLYDKWRFDSQIDSSGGATACWPWLGSVNNCGYGLFSIWHRDERRRKMMTPHRLALIAHLGRELAPGMNANHVCHNRLCCNPNHLMEGTQHAKLMSMVADNRLVLGRQPGVKTGSYNHRQWNREYLWTDEEIQWYRTASIDDIVARTGLDRARAASRRYTFRHGFAWLPHPVEEYIPDRRGRKKSAA